MQILIILNYWKNNVIIDSNNLVVLNEENSLPKIDGFKITSGRLSDEEIEKFSMPPATKGVYQVCPWRGC